MPLLSPSALAVRFRSLSITERYALLAAIWRERGSHTRIVDDCLVAEGETRTERIAVVGPLTRSVPADIDVVVATHDRSRIRELAGTANADVLDPDALRDLLAYGIERDRGEAIAREHLGTSLTVPEPDPPPTPRQGAVAVLVLIVLLAVPLLALSGAGLPSAVVPFAADDPGSDGFDSDDAGPDDSLVGSAVDGDDDRVGSDPIDESVGDDGSVAGDDARASDSASTSPYPPGTDADGVVDAARLIETHRDRIEDAERAYWVEYDGPETAAFGDRRAFRLDASMHDPERFLVEGESRWRTERETAAVNDSEGANATGTDSMATNAGEVFDEIDGPTGTNVGNSSTITEAYWADGERTHTRLVANDSERLSNTSIGTDPVALRLERHAHHLLYTTVSTAETETERDDWRGWRLVQVSGSADRVTVDDETYSDVTLTSTFTSDGELVGFRLTYHHEPTGVPAQLTFQYHPEDDVPPPDPPAWYEERR
ncbi:hypothetical protein [Halorubrum vacuolatum]|uniref:Uncharacterized protein n=1 Tax=Halorubrum vacuolatum TaxID=63740 RepID=A0A238UP50_HALVU|nr:hypothetical protein [Halorubrum vacuolatum]SNR23865.1 hypothetical protein SAMN06264855_101182 [Halorubrum vacuolatum]